jgi:hypothetical protein
MVYKALYFVSVILPFSNSITKLLNTLFKTNLYVYFILCCRFALELKRF